MPPTQIPTAVQTIFVNAENKYLLQMRNNHPGIIYPLQWGFFGGGIDGDEPVTTAACRETFEEMGIEQAPEDFELLGTIPHTIVTGQLVYVFRYQKPIEWNMIRLAEGAGAGFFSTEEIQLIDANPLAKQIASRFLDKSQAID